MNHKLDTKTSTDSETSLSTQQNESESGPSNDVECHLVGTHGRHLIAEYFDCSTDTLNDVARVEALLNEAAIAAGATIVNSVFHRFCPQGVSGVVVIAESHISIHTWPESGYAAVDFFTCGDCQPHLAHLALTVGLEAKRAELLLIQRGRLGRKMTQEASTWSAED